MAGKRKQSYKYKNKIKKYLPSLTYLYTAQNKNKLISKLEPSLIKIIADICKNCLPNGCLHHKAVKNAQLCKCLSSLEILADSHTPIKKKKQLIQSGGASFLLPLLSLGIPTLVELIKNI
jgi:hypothetical protein